MREQPIANERNGTEPKKKERKLKQNNFSFSSFYYFHAVEGVGPTDVCRVPRSIDGLNSIHFNSIASSYSTLHVVVSRFLLLLRLTAERRTCV